MDTSERVAQSDGESVNRHLMTSSAPPANQRATLNQPKEDTVLMPPRKRKLRQRQQQQQVEQSTSSVDLTRFNFFPRLQPHQDKALNPYEQFLDIRKKIAQRHRELQVIKPKAPREFKDYLMVKKNYILQGNSASRSLDSLMLKPPVDLHESLKELFTEQEGARQRLRVQHKVERVRCFILKHPLITPVHLPIPRHSHVCILYYFSLYSEHSSFLYAL